MRYRPIGLGLPRTATLDLALAGVRIPAGTNTAAANRTPPAFGSPDRLDIARATTGWHAELRKRRALLAELTPSPARTQPSAERDGLAHAQPPPHRTSPVDVDDRRHGPTNLPAALISGSSSTPRVPPASALSSRSRHSRDDVTYSVSVLGEDCREAACCRRPRGPTSPPRQTSRRNATAPGPPARRRPGPSRSRPLRGPVLRLERGASSQAARVGCRPCFKSNAVTLRSARYLMPSSKSEAVTPSAFARSPSRSYRSPRLPNSTSMIMFLDTPDLNDNCSCVIPFSRRNSTMRAPTARRRLSHTFTRLGSS